MGFLESYYLWVYDYKWLLQIDIAVIFFIGYLSARYYVKRGWLHIILLIAATSISSAILIPVMVIRFFSGLEGLFNIPPTAINVVLSIAAVGLFWWIVHNGFISSSHTKWKWVLRQESRKKHSKKGLFVLLFWALAVITGTVMIMIS